MAALTFKIGGDASGLTGALNKAKSGLQGLAKLGGKLAIGGALAGAAVGAGALAGALQGVRLAGDMEQLAVAFEVLTGSAEQARKTISELTALSDSTPLTPEDVLGAGRSLLAFGVAADEVGRSLTMLGDISLGVGAPIGEIAELFGKAKVQGRLFGEDINQLTGRGIPVLSELAAVMGVGAEQVMGLVTGGKLGFPELEAALQRMTRTGGQFGGMMARQATTFNGLISTLRGKFSALLRGFGAGLLEAGKELVRRITGIVVVLTPLAERLGRQVGRGLEIGLEALRTGALGGILRDGAVLALKEAVNVLLRGVAAAGALFVALLESAFSKLSDPSYWAGLGEIFKGLGSLLAGALEASMAPLLAKFSKRGEDFHRQRAALLERKGIAEIGIGGARIDQAGNGLSTAEVMAQAMARALAAYQASGSALSTGAEMGRLRVTIEGLNRAIEARKAREEAPQEADAQETPNPFRDAGKVLGDLVQNATRPLVSSLAAVGGAALGGGAANPLDRERNRLLKSIEQNTRGGSLATFA